MMSRTNEIPLDLYRQISDLALEGVVITRLDQTIIYVNQSFLRITGYTEEELKNKKPSILRSGKHGKSFYEDLWNGILTESYWEGEIWNKRKNGEIYPQWLSIHTIHDSTGNAAWYLGLFADLSEVERGRLLMEHKSYEDTVSGLPNRMYFFEKVKQAILHCSIDKDKRFGIIYLDLDSFKNVNDVAGQSVGDRVLRHVAQRLHSQIRGDDVLARVGGDEFAILLHEGDALNDLDPIARRILTSLQDPIVYRHREFYLTASMGIALYPEDGTDTEVLIRNADMALHRAKESGKNGYRKFSSQMSQEALRKLELESALRKAVENREILVFLQPFLELSTGRIIGMEALARWIRPDEGMIPPVEFIPIAEASGLIESIGLFILEESCRITRDLLEEHQDGFFDQIRVAVNISGRQIQKSHFVEDVRRILNQAGLSGRYLEFEVTESMIMEDTESIIRTMRQLNELEIHLSIDDFGTGYSSLSYLKRFPIDKLKIDKSFIRDIPVDRDDMTITRTIITMAHTLNLKVIAEGVESREQLDFLLANDCDFMQGYLISKPIPEAEFKQLLRQRKQLEMGINAAWMRDFLA